MLDEKIGWHVRNKLSDEGNFDQLIATVERRDKTPYAVVNEILTKVLR